MFFSASFWCLLCLDSKTGGTIAALTWSAGAFDLQGLQPPGGWHFLGLFLPVFPFVRDESVIS
jgi:hypothetical protein